MIEITEQRCQDLFTNRENEGETYDEIIRFPSFSCLNTPVWAQK